MGLVKRTYTDNVTVITAENLNDIQDNIIAQEANKADKSDTYTKTEVNTALALKADKSDTYTKSETDAAIEENMDEIRTVRHTDLLLGKTSIPSWYINPSTGEGSSLASFFSYENIEIPPSANWLYPYANISATVNYIRSVCFYDENDDFISGISGSAAYVTQGIEIPDGAKTVSCSIALPSEGYDGKHYLSTLPGENQSFTGIKDSVVVPGKSVVGLVKTENIRKAVINFQFDDGPSQDASIVAIFKSKNARCGFALIADTISSTPATRANHLRYQNDGFEMMSHSTDSVGMNDPTVDLSVIDTKLRQSKTTLESLGFIINGFVTPNSTMAEKFKTLLRKYYNWADTVYLGEYTGAQTPYNTVVDGVYNLKRVSLQSSTLANAKDAVDKCIADRGCLTFYGHAVALDTTDYLTTENLEELLDYINAKISAGLCEIKTPSEAIMDYYTVRNDDVSDGWVGVTSEEAQLDSRFNVNFWSMSYNEKLKLLYFSIRVNPKEAVSGQINALFVFPKKIDENALIQNETGRNCLVYSNSLLIQGSNTWSQGTNYRFSGMLKLK